MAKSRSDQSRSKSLKGGEMPGMEFQEMAEAQRGNIDAIMKAHLIVIQGTHVIAKKQALVLQETFDGIASLATEIMEKGDPQKTSLTNPKATQAGFERALAHMKGLMDVMMETNMSVFDVMNARLMEIFERPDN